MMLGINIGDVYFELKSYGRLVHWRPPRAFAVVHSLIYAVDQAVRLHI